VSAPKCSPLCGATAAYGRFVKPWEHASMCPVRIAWENERRLLDVPANKDTDE
jgi:hypothetical protein